MVLADGHRAAGLIPALSTFSTSCLLVAACQGLGYASCLRRAILWSVPPVMPRPDFLTSEIRRLLRGGIL
jgi:hypothetical protein